MMVRRAARPAALHQYTLEPYQRHCPGCGGTARVAYHDRRTVATLDGLYALVLVVRLCREPACPLYRRPYRPEEEGGWALLARSLLGATEDDLVPLLREVHAALPVPISGVISDGQASIRKAVPTD